MARGYAGKQEKTGHGFFGLLVDKCILFFYVDCLRISFPTSELFDRGIGIVRKKLGRGRKNRCRFCTKEGCPRPAFVDYKDVQGLKKLCTNQGKLFSRKRSGNCAAFQRASKVAIKRARFMALMPYVGE